MKQEDKELLLQDLSARLPYGVIVQYPNIFRPSEIIKRRLEEISYSLIGIDEYKININDDGIDIEYVKPYLRPMSSMTEEEFEEYGNITEHISIGSLDFNIANPNAFDWLNANHFDYRGLIERGLAIAVTKENNPYK